jgi:hypothetical protein
LQNTRDISPSEAKIFLTFNNIFLYKRTVDVSSHETKDASDVDIGISATMTKCIT